MKQMGSSIATLGAAILAAIAFAYLLHSHLAVTPLSAAIAGGILFSVFVSIASFVRSARLANRLNQLEDGIRSHEERLSERIGAVEATVPAISRIERLERKLATQKRPDVQSEDIDNLTAFYEKTKIFKTPEQFQPQSVFEEPDTGSADNVIRLHPNPPKPEVPAASASIKKTGQTSKSGFDLDEVLIRLQPAVSLESREIFAFETSTCAQGWFGQMHEHEEILSALTTEKEKRRFDKRVSAQVMGLVRSLRRQGKSPLVFVSVSPATLKSTSAFETFDETLEAQKKLAKNIIWEVRQADHANFSKTQRARLRQICDHGFALCLSDCTDQDAAADTLLEGLFDYVKMPIAELEHVKAITLKGPQCELMVACEKAGTTVIVTDVEHEKQAIHLIDHQVRYAQGNFFSPPKFPASGRHSRQKATEK